MFKDLISICDDLGFDLTSKCIIADFEINNAAINAMTNVFPERQQKLCFFHLYVPIKCFTHSLTLNFKSYMLCVLTNSKILYYF